eukprot:s1885_g4.t1
MFSAHLQKTDHALDAQGSQHTEISRTPIGLQGRGINRRRKGLKPGSQRDSLHQPLTDSVCFPVPDTAHELDFRFQAVQSAAVTESQSSEVS